MIARTHRTGNLDMIRTQSQLMPGKRPIALLLMAGLLAGVSLSQPAHSAPTGVALVIGNGRYSTLSPLPACTVSSRSVSSTLRQLGFAVTERQDVSTGQLEAGIDAFQSAVEASPDVPTVVYFCGYAAGFNNRAFLLSVSASIQQPSDTMTQGMLAKALVDSVARSGHGPALVVLDVFQPGTSLDPLGLATLDRADLPATIGLLGVTEANDDTGGLTPLATALVPVLQGAAAEITQIPDQVTRRLSTTSTVTISLHRDAAAPVAAAQSAPVEPPPVVAAEPIAPPSSLPASTLGSRPREIAAEVSDETQMNDVDRRTIQAALGRLGYYSGRIDGAFGAETRAAIRRLQFELRAPMTGIISGDQMHKLASNQ